MYVLLYVDYRGSPAYIQAPNLELLNQQVRTLWEQTDIDQDSWGDDAYQLLYIEENELTHVNHSDCAMVPQFTVF